VSIVGNREAATDQSVSQYNAKYMRNVFKNELLLFNIIYFIFISK